MIMSKFVRLTKGLADRGVLIKESDIDSNLTDANKDYYTSLYYYTDEHLKKFKETGSVKGIRDVTTNKLWFDFDSKEDPSLAQKDTKTLVGRLIASGIKPNSVQVYFTGSKGFHVIVETNRTLTPELVASLAINKFGKGLETLDPSLYDCSQVLRVAGTKHNVTGLYKIPLTISQLNTLPIDNIKARAKSLDNITDDFSWDTATLSDDAIKVVEETKPTPKVEQTEDEVDFLNKPKQWRSCKWSLLQGNFKSGQRHDALMTIAATCKGLGYDKETTYYMCKSALKKQALKHNTDEFPKDELYNNVVDSVFTDGWEGGQYSCQKPGWLQKYCKELGRHSCSATEGTELIDANSIYNTFEDYAKNFERNLVKTGIRELDENVMFLTSTHNGVLGQPGSGKTSLALQWLCESSKQGSASIFYSLDMGKPVIYGKLVQKYLGCSFKEAVKICRENPTKLATVKEQIARDFKNVKFNFKSAVTPEIIRQDIKDHEAATGQKVRLIITDYLECLSGPFSDSLANVAFISQQMKDIANELQVCSVMLLQTQKHSTADVSDALMSMKQIKGSSVIEQSSSVILTLWREGYNPKTIDEDRYMSFACVKNRFGSLWTDDFKWSGRNGLIGELTEEERFELEEFRKRKAEAKAATAESSGGWS